MVFCGLAKTSTLDFPGMVAAVLFSPGCNYDCFYCHNRALLGGDTPPLASDDIMRFLQKRQGLLDGLVLSGGEATLQDGIAEFIIKVKELGYKVKLDTNGSRPDVVRQLLDQKLLDYVAMDYKAPFARYPEICGPNANPEPVMETYALLLNSGVDFEIRTTVIPQLTMDEIVMMARELAPAPSFVLQGYRIPESFKPQDRFRIAQRPYEPQFLEQVAQNIKAYQPGVLVR